MLKKKADALSGGRVKFRHLVLDLLGCVCEEDGRVGVAGRHLGLSSLKRGEEGGVEQRRLGVADPGSHVTGHPEVGVLGEREPEGRIPSI